MAKNNTNNLARPQKITPQSGTAADFDTEGRKPDWCPGCGDFGIMRATKDALFELKIPRQETVIVSGIGCGSKMPQWINTFGFHTLHGRSLPVASGIKLANPKLTVIDVAGDGDCYGIGVGHFIHACRRNLGITLITQNNQVYGLTKGQTSPTSEKNFKTNSTPYGAIETPVNPLTLALASNATFVARTFSGNMAHAKEMFKAAIQHEGFALVDVFQPCITFNKLNTFGYFNQRIYDLQKTGHDKSDYKAALEKAHEEEKLPIGIFYQKESKSYEEQLPKTDTLPITKHDLSKISVQKLIDYYR